jgi:hypothetical protein
VRPRSVEAGKAVVLARRVERRLCCETWFRHFSCPFSLSPKVSTVKNILSPQRAAPGRRGLIGERRRIYTGRRHLL